jgi:glycosyltransferase involved in cell wall biosynthesis
LTSVCIVSPAWGRLDITRLVLAQRQRLCVELASRGIEARSLIVGSDENLDLADEYGSDTLEVPNRPLGQKCNLGFRHALERAPDFIVWVGSDDWIHPDVFQPLIDRTRDELTSVIIAGHRLAIVDMHTGRLQRCSSPSKYGAIPWIIDSRLFTMHPKLHPIQPELGHGLDGALIRGLRRSRIRFTFVMHDPHDFRCVDFKSNRNITPYEGFAKNLGIGDPELAWDALRERYAADLVNDARRLHEEMAQRREERR